MSQEVRCPKCKVENRAGAIFCKGCGAKLGAAQISMRNAPSGGVGGRGLYLIVRVVILLALLTVLGLVLWPIPPSGQVGGEHEIETLSAKIGQAKHAIEYRQGVNLQISDAEINAALAEGLRQTEQTGRRKLVAVRMAFAPGRIRVGADTRIGPVRLTYDVTGVPGTINGAFAFKPKQARFGHLPIPAPAVPLVANRLAQVFSRMEDEKSILSYAQSMEIGKGHVNVLIQSRP